MKQNETENMKEKNNEKGKYGKGERRTEEIKQTRKQTKRGKKLRISEMLIKKGNEREAWKEKE